MLSYTQAALAKDCPLLYHESYNRKRRKELNPETPAMIRGIKEHDLYEKVVKGEISKDAAALQCLNIKALSHVLQIAAEHGRPLGAEKSARVDIDDRYCFQLYCDALSTDIDVATDVLLLEYKTGRFRKEFVEQSRTYALFLFLKYDNLQEIHARILGIGSKFYDQVFTFRREELPRLMEEVTPGLALAVALREGAAAPIPKKNWRCKDCLMVECPLNPGHEDNMGGKDATRNDTAVI